MLKKILFSTILVASTFVSYSFAQENCLEFTAGTICLNIENQGNGNYKVTKTFSNKGTYKNMYMLNCRILTPDNKLKELGSCEKSFKYTGIGTKPVRLYIRLETEKKTLNMDYNFSNINVKEKQTVEKIYKSWETLVEKLTAKYPNLKTNEEWNTLATSAYENIGNYYYGKTSKIKSYAEFKKVIIDFITYTKKSIKK